MYRDINRGFELCISERGVRNGHSYRSSVRDLDSHSRSLDLDGLQYTTCQRFLTYDRNDWQDLGEDNSSTGELLLLYLLQSLALLRK